MMPQGHGWGFSVYGKAARFRREDAFRSGGIVEFTMAGNRVQFDVNLGAPSRAGLKVCYKLLAFAHQAAGIGRVAGN